MRLLGIDYGAKRIGIAISDPEGKIAFPRNILINHGIKSVTVALENVIDAEGIGQVVIGLPIGLEQKDTQETKEVRRFAKHLSARVRIPMCFENEMFTTRLAESAGKGKMSDASAAAIMLQAYMDKKIESGI